jgi:hypothetical protein
MIKTIPNDKLIDRFERTLQDCKNKNVFKVSDSTGIALQSAMSFILATEQR